MSATLVAEKLGYPGCRSSIIGKAHRLGVDGGNRNKPLNALDRRPLNPKRSAPLPALRIAEGPAKPVHILDIGEAQCRWIITPDRTPFNDMRMCGARCVEGLSWCPAHADLAFAK